MIIGRNKEKREIYKLLQEKKSFILLGIRGIGKTALLKWAYSVAPKPKAFISARVGITTFLREFCMKYVEVSDKEPEWEVRKEGLAVFYKRVGEVKEYPVFNRMSKTELYNFVLEECGEGGFLFVDDLEKATFEMCQLLYDLSIRFVLCLAGNEPFRDEQKKVIWGCKEIKLCPLNKKEALALAKEAGFGPEVARSGIPGKILAGETLREGRYIEGEEVNIAPVFLLVLAVVVIIRYIGLGTGEKELYILGGIGTALAAIIRFYIYRMMRK